VEFTKRPKTEKIVIEGDELGKFFVPYIFLISLEVSLDARSKLHIFKREVFTKVCRRDRPL